MPSPEMVKLSEVASFIRGITFKPSDVVPVGSPGSVACMRTKNVQSELDLSDVWGVDEKFVKKNDQYLTPGDTLVSSANSWNLVGKCCLVPKMDFKASFGGFVSVLRAKEDLVDPRYLYHWFSSDKIQATIRGYGRQTTNISNLDIKRCLKMEFPLLDLSDQRRISDDLQKIIALQEKHRRSLGLLSELFDSARQRAFRGDLWADSTD